MTKQRLACVGIMIMLAVAAVGCASAGLKLKQGRVVALEAAVAAALRAQAIEIAAYDAKMPGLTEAKHKAVQSDFLEIFAVLETRRSAIAAWDPKRPPIMPVLFDDIAARLEALNARIEVIQLDGGPVAAATFARILEELQRAIAWLRGDEGGGLDDTVLMFTPMKVVR